MKVSMKEVAKVAVFSLGEGGKEIPERKLAGFTRIQDALDAVPKLARLAVLSPARVRVFDRQGNPI